MSFTASIRAGMPPSGKGVYLRDQGADYAVALPWCNIVAINAKRRDALDDVERVKAAGKQAWLYSMPSEWTPNAWPQELERIKAMAKASGADGFIANPEAPWPQLARAEREAKLSRLGAELGRAANETRVGIVSIAAFPGIRTIASETRGKVWGSPELYSPHSRSEMSVYMERWKQAFGESRVIPSISGYIPPSALGETLREPEKYREYLANLPFAVGAIAWMAAGGPLPGYMEDALSAYNPTGNRVYGSVLLARSILSNPFSVIIAALIFLGVGAGIATVVKR